MSAYYAMRVNIRSAKAPDHNEYIEIQNFIIKAVNSGITEIYLTEEDINTYCYFSPLKWKDVGQLYYNDYITIHTDNECLKLIQN